MKTMLSSKGDRAIDAALRDIGGNERTAVIILFFAAARKLGATFDRETAGELAYMMADDLATGVQK